MAFAQLSSDDLIRPANEIIEFVEAVARREKAPYVGTERRSELRYEIILPVVAQPMDDVLRPAGERFAAFTSDISNGGVRLLHTEPVETRFLALELTDHEGKKLQAAVEVLRCHAATQRCYAIGGKFVVKVYDSPIVKRPPQHQQRGNAQQCW